MLQRVISLWWICGFPGVMHALHRNITWSELSIIRVLNKTKAFYTFEGQLSNKSVFVKMENANADRDSHQELVKEIKFLRKMNHSNIIEIHGSGHHPNLFMVLEKLEGGTLSRKISDRFRRKGEKAERKDDLFLTNSTMPIALQYALDLARAIRYLHESYSELHRLIHADLKPSNVGFTASGKLKLFDFGLSTQERKVNDDMVFKLPIVGTWLYKAPEVINKRLYNHKIDVFSFGVILFEMICGKHPRLLAPGKDVRHRSEYYKLIANMRWRPPLDDPRWNKDLKSLILRSWSHNISIRPNFVEIESKLKLMV